jgi:hypothetical protein
MKSSTPNTQHSAPSLLALAYPDRIGKRRPGQEGRFLLRNGLGVFTTAPSLARAEWIVAAELDGDPKESKLYLGAALDEAEVRELYADQITLSDEVSSPIRRRSRAPSPRHLPSRDSPSFPGATTRSNSALGSPSSTASTRRGPT